MPYITSGDGGGIVHQPFFLFFSPSLPVLYNRFLNLQSIPDSFPSTNAVVTVAAESNSPYLPQGDGSSNNDGDDGGRIHPFPLPPSPSLPSPISNLQSFLDSFFSLSCSFSQGSKNNDNNNVEALTHRTSSSSKILMNDAINENLPKLKREGRKKN